MESLDTIIVLGVMAICFSIVSRTIHHLRLRLKVMEGLLQLHHNQFPWVRDLLILHHAIHYPDEQPKEFIWPETKESTSSASRD